MVSFVGAFMMRWFHMDLDGRSVRVAAQKVQGRLWFHLDGQTYVYEKQNGRARKGGVKEATGVIEAPMPGKILRVDVTTGSEVKIGQTLVVMEAMKMEYTLAADKAGVIGEVGCQVGDQVGLGQLLVRIEGENG